MFLITLRNIIKISLLVFVGLLSQQSLATEVIEVIFGEELLHKIVQREQALFEQLEILGPEKGLGSLSPTVREIANDYETFIDNNPDCVYAYILYGKFLQKIGHKDIASKLFFKADKLDPNISVVKQQISNFFAEKGMYAEALKYLLEAIKIDPDVAAYHYQIGELLFHFKSNFLDDEIMDEAIHDASMLESFAKAAHLLPTNKILLFRYAEAFYDVNNPDWQKALDAWESIESSQNELTAFEHDRIRINKALTLIHLQRQSEALELLNGLIHPDLEYDRQQILNKLH